MGYCIQDALFLLGPPVQIVIREFCNYQVMCRVLRYFFKNNSSLILMIRNWHQLLIGPVACGNQQHVMTEGGMFAHQPLPLPAKIKYPGFIRGNIVVVCPDQQKANSLPFWWHSSKLKFSVQNHHTRSILCTDRQHLLSLVPTLDPSKALVLQLVYHPAVPLWSLGIA